MKALRHPLHFHWQDALALPRRVMNVILYDLRCLSFMSGSLFLAILAILFFMAVQAH